MVVVESRGASLESLRSSFRGNVCPARSLCIDYLISSPTFILTLGTGLQTFLAMRIQQHKMSLPPLPTTTLVIVINWGQRMGQNF